MVYHKPHSINQFLLKMNKFYPFATMLLSIFLLSDVANAQTYSGGTYTAVRNRTWHVESGVNAWDANGEPPASCVNCQIVISSGVTVTLNKSITLSGGSALQIGTDGSAATALIINASAGTDIPSGYNIILKNDGSSPENKLILNSSLDMINATNGSTYDGVFSAYVSGSNTTYSKLVGQAPSTFQNNTVILNATPTYQILTGAKSLSASGTLPIVISEFTATLNGSQVNLAWTTALEVNSDHFTIQRSTDNGATWKDLATVAAQGNSSSPVNYSWTDANAAGGVSEYRLVLVDLDKKTAYSIIKTVRAGLTTGVSIYPNPASSYVNVSIAATENNALSIRLLNQSGQLLVEKKVSNAGGTTVSVPVSAYPTGNYLIVVKSSDGSQQVNKVFITK